MLFGDVEFPLHFVIAFNDRVTWLYRNDAVANAENAVGVALDASGSMKKRQREVALTLSALKCMTRTQNAFNAPDPERGTRIVDTVDELAKCNALASIQKLVIITDGADTDSVRQQVIKCFSADGAPEMVDLPKWPTQTHQEWVRKVVGVPGTPSGAESDDESDDDGPDLSLARFYAWRGEQVDERSRCVAQHLDALNIDTFVVGMGHEVKTFIAECAQPGRGLRTAHIDNGASVETVGAIMSSVVRRQRRQRSSIDVDDTVDAGNARAITPTEAEAVRVEAERTTTSAERKSNPNLLIDGPPFDGDLQAQYVAHVVDAETRKLYTKAGVAHDTNELAPIAQAAVQLFQAIARSAATPVASAIFTGCPARPSGKKLPSGSPDGRHKCALLEIPSGFDWLKIGRWTRALGTIVELLARNPEMIRERLGVPFPAALEAAIGANQVGPLFRHAGKPASRIAITHEMYAHPDLASRVMYFKFKAATYDHFILHHRDPRPADVPPLLAEKCHIMITGNTSAKAYGSSEIGCATPQAQAQPSSPSSASASTNDCGEPQDPASADEVPGLKRKVDELSQELADVKAQNKTLKTKLANIFKQCTDSAN